MFKGQHPGGGGGCSKCLKVSIGGGGAASV